MNRVLIVDDREANRRLLRALLHGHGYEVEEARHGAEALVRARQAPPRLIISDLLMPVMDGYTLLRHWKADERLKEIPFVVYTATYTDPKDERLALELGADAFLLKPTEPEVFTARIQAVLAKAERHELSPARAPGGGESLQLREYSEVLVRKLEEKAVALEAINRTLQHDLAERAQAQEEMRQRNRELAALSRIIAATSATLDLQAAVDHLLRGALELTGLEGGTFFLVDHSTHTLRLAAHLEASPAMVRDLIANVPRVGDCLCGHCAKTCEPLIHWDGASGSQLATRETTRKEGLRFHAAFPLCLKGGCLGVLCLFAKSASKPTERALALVGDLCGPVALAIENARLYETANRELAERKQAEVALRRSRQQLRALWARVQRLREEERTRLAREVHDALGQLLTALKMDVGWCARRLAQIPEDLAGEALRQKHADLDHLADRMIETVQRIARELRPSVLDNLGLAAALQFEARQFQERTGLACEITALPEGLELEPERATAVFRVFQEILSNVARHAQATSVRVGLTQAAERVVLEVSDNGRGLTAADLSAASSLGLLGMQERAALLGGEITFRGEPGQGTTVTLAIPRRSLPNGPVPP